jgi:hypothetical protein
MLTIEIATVTLEFEGVAYEIEVIIVFGEQ